MRLRRGERDQQALTPNQLVAQRIALARQLRGWTQEAAADRLEKFLGARWSPATFSIVERSVDGKRIRQFTADELVALSRVFEVPIGWWFTPSWGDAAAVVVTPDAPDGLPSQLMVDVVMGDIEGFETWANELLLSASNQRVIVEIATGKIVRQDSVSPPHPTLARRLRPAAGRAGRRRTVRRPQRRQRRPYPGARAPRRTLDARTHTR